MSHKTNGVSDQMKVNGKTTKKSIKLLDEQDVCGDDKQLYLIKLPKELKKYKELKLNLNNIKNGDLVKINDIEYEAELIKTKNDFNTIVSNDGEYKAVSNFKYIIQLKRYIDIEPVNVPQIENDKFVQVPKQIEEYINHKKEQLQELEANQSKKTSKKSKKRKTQDETNSFELSIKKESIESDSHAKKHSKKHKIK